MNRRVRGAALMEYALLLVVSLMIIGATAKLLGTKSGRGPGRTAAHLQAGI